ncbi:MAG: hypothetical protein ACK4VI_01390 [Alphaproteobacteria bacterium]
MAEDNQNIPRIELSPETIAFLESRPSGRVTIDHVANAQRAIDSFNNNLLRNIEVLEDRVRFLEARGWLESSIMDLDFALYDQPDAPELRLARAYQGLLLDTAHLYDCTENLNNYAQAQRDASSQLGRRDFSALDITPADYLALSPIERQIVDVYQEHYSSLLEVSSSAVLTQQLNDFFRNGNLDSARTLIQEQIVAARARIETPPAEGATIREIADYRSNVRLYETLEMYNAIDAILQQDNVLAAQAEGHNAYWLEAQNTVLTLVQNAQTPEEAAFAMQINQLFQEVKPDDVSYDYTQFGYATAQPDPSVGSQFEIENDPDWLRAVSIFYGQVNETFIASDTIEFFNDPENRHYLESLQNGVVPEDLPQEVIHELSNWGARVSRFFSMNTAVAADIAIGFEANYGGEDPRAAIAFQRMLDSYHNFTYFNSWRAVGETAQAIVTDPINIAAIGVGAVTGGVGGASIRVAAESGKIGLRYTIANIVQNHVLSSGLRSAMVAGYAEGLAGGLVINWAEQNVEVVSGRSEEFSVTRMLMAAQAEALGGVVLSGGGHYVGRLLTRGTPDTPVYQRSPLEADSAAPPRLADDIEAPSQPQRMPEMDAETPVLPAGGSTPRVFAVEPTVLAAPSPADAAPNVVTSVPPAPVVDFVPPAAPLPPLQRAAVPGISDSLSPFNRFESRLAASVDGVEGIGPSRVTPAAPAAPVADAAPVVDASVPPAPRSAPSDIPRRPAGWGDMTPEIRAQRIDAMSLDNPDRAFAFMSGRLDASELRGVFSHLDTGTQAVYLARLSVENPQRANQLLGLDGVDTVAVNNLIRAQREFQELSGAASVPPRADAPGAAPSPEPTVAATRTGATPPGHGFKQGDDVLAYLNGQDFPGKFDELAGEHQGQWFARVIQDDGNIGIVPLDSLSLRAQRTAGAPQPNAAAAPEPTPAAAAAAADTATPAAAAAAEPQRSLLRRITDVRGWFGRRESAAPTAAATPPPAAAAATPPPAAAAATPPPAAAAGPYTPPKAAISTGDMNRHVYGVPDPTWDQIFARARANDAAAGLNANSYYRLGKGTVADPAEVTELYRIALYAREMQQDLIRSGKTAAEANRNIAELFLTKLARAEDRGLSHQNAVELIIMARISGLGASMRALLPAPRTTGDTIPHGFSTEFMDTIVNAAVDRRSTRGFHWESVKALFRGQSDRLPIFEDDATMLKFARERFQFFFSDIGQYNPYRSLTIRHFFGDALGMRPKGDGTYGGFSFGRLANFWLGRVPTANLWRSAELGWGPIGKYTLRGAAVAMAFTSAHLAEEAIESALGHDLTVLGHHVDASGRIASLGIDIVDMTVGNAIAVISDDGFEPSLWGPGYWNGREIATWGDRFDSQPPAQEMRIPPIGAQNETGAADAAVVAAAPAPPAPAPDATPTDPAAAAAAAAAAAPAAATTEGTGENGGVLAGGAQVTRDALATAQAYDVRGAMPSTIQAGMDVVGGLSFSRIGATISENLGGAGRYMLNVFNALPATMGRGWGTAAQFAMLGVGALVSWNIVSGVFGAIRNFSIWKAAGVVGAIIGAAALVDYFNRDHSSHNPINRNTIERQTPGQIGRPTLNDDRTGSTLDHIRNGGVVQGASLHVPVSPENARAAIVPAGLQTEFATAALALSDDRAAGLDRDMRASGHDGIPFTVVRYTSADEAGWTNASDVASGLAVAANDGYGFIAAQSGLGATVAPVVASAVAYTDNGHVPTEFSATPVVSASYDVAAHVDPLAAIGWEERRGTADQHAPQTAQVASVTFDELTARV